MVQVLTLVNSLTSTSIPVEIANKVQEVSDDVDVSVASFYDPAANDTTATEHLDSVQLVNLDAQSRFDIRAYVELRKLVTEREFDVFHTHPNATGSFARLFLADLSVLMISTEHSDHNSYSTLQRLVGAVSLPVADVVVSNSKNTSDSFRRYEQLLMRGGDHEVVHNGVDLQLVSACRGTDPPDAVPTGPNIVTVGRLVNVKNHATLFRALAKVKDRFSEVDLLVVGDGPKHDVLVSLRENLGIEDSIHFLGHLDRREVYRILHHSTLSAVPSRREGFCVAAVEAMACGLPVVASNIEVLTEVVGDVGVYATWNEPQSFAEALTALLDDDERRRRLGRRARARATERFPLERTADEYCKIYKRLVTDDK